MFFKFKGEMNEKPQGFKMSTKVTCHLPKVGQNMQKYVCLFWFP